MLETAERAESILHNAFLMKGDDFAFNIPKAMLVGITTDENGKLIDVNPELASSEDIYDLLENVDASLFKNFTAIGMVTCGWASPIKEGKEAECAPSDHPERRRVRLFMCVNRQHMASIMRFQDDPTEQVSDAGQARGPLAEAILHLMNQA